MVVFATCFVMGSFHRRCRFRCRTDRRAARSLLEFRPDFREIDNQTSAQTLLGYDLRLQPAASAWDVDRLAIGPSAQCVPKLGAHRHCATGHNGSEGARDDLLSGAQFSGILFGLLREELECPLDFLPCRDRLYDVADLA